MAVSGTWDPRHLLFRHKNRCFSDKWLKFAKSWLAHWNSIHNWFYDRETFQSVSPIPYMHMVLEQCTPDISRSIFFQQLTRDTHSSPDRASYGCLAWYPSLTEVWPSNLVYCAWCCVIYTVQQSSPSHCQCAIIVWDEAVGEYLWMSVRCGWAGGERDHLGCLFAQPDPLFDGLGIGPAWDEPSDGLTNYYLNQ